MEAYWKSRPYKWTEIRGPFPHSVIMMGKKPDPNAYQNERERIRKQAQDIDRGEAELRHRREQRQKVNMEGFLALNDRRLLLKQARAKVNAGMHLYELGVERRRERLKQQLADDELKYCYESLADVDSIESRIERDRAKIKAIRERKEAKRLEYVQEKLKEQQATQNADVRSQLSMRIRLETAQDQLKQIQVNEEMRKREKRIDDIYNQFNDADYEARRKREEREVQGEMLRNCEQVASLQKQMAAKEEKKRAEKQLIAEEANNLTDQQKRWAEAEEQSRVKQEEDKRKLHDAYNQQIRFGRERRAKDLKSELVVDMKLAEQNLASMEEETNRHHQDKKERRDEMLRYLQYLKDEKRREAELEKRSDEIIQCEVRKDQEKQERKWRLDREARGKLKCEVAAINARRRQDKELADAEEKKKGLQIRKAVLHGIAEAEKFEEERRRKEEEKKRAYGCDLLGQIDYNARQKKAEEEANRHFLQRRAEQEEEYQRKIVELLADPSLKNVNSRRMKLCKDQLEKERLELLKNQQEKLDGRLELCEGRREKVNDESTEHCKGHLEMINWQC